MRDGLFVSGMEKFKLKRSNNILIRYCILIHKLLKVLYKDIFNVVLFLIALLSVSEILFAMDFDTGVALRQNLILMKRPTGMEIVYKEKTFGISETRTRIWLGVRFDDVEIKTALDVRGNFNSFGEVTNNVFKNEGSLLGVSRPLER